jgi:threonine dehydratase
MDAPGDAVTPQTIAQCERVIRPYIRRTPVIEINGREFGLTANTISLKLELLQHSGSFKARGAFSNLLTRAIPQTGVVAASGGNHGAAVAYAAMRLGKPAKIFVPSVSSTAKIQRIRDYGADLTIEGDRYADALAASEAWMLQTGAMPVPAFDQDETIVGQGTVGFELDEQAADIDTVLVSVGGGGLVAGIAAWYAGRIKVIGVEPLASPTLTKALEAGHPVDAEAGGLAADSLAPRRVGERVFPIVQKYAPKTVLVSDDAIAEAQATLWRALRIVAEPGGAAAFSAILSGAYRPDAGERVAVVISGGNTAAVNFDITR